MPLFADATYPMPESQPTDPPPPNLTTAGHGGPGATFGMNCYCIARHGRGINVAFLDGHAARVPLEELWKLRWHNEWVARDVTLPAE